MDDDSIIREFLAESQENLDQLDRAFVELERDPGNRDLLSAIFRTIHTIKGTSGFLGFSRLESLTHVGENLLSQIRDGALALTPEITDPLLAMVDAVREILADIGESGAESDRNYDSLLESLRRLNGAAAQRGSDTEDPSCGTDVETAQTELRTDSGQEDPSTQVPPSPIPHAAVAKTDGAAAIDESANSTSRGAPIADSSIRVDVELLDTLMNLVGELVLARNQILQHTASLTNTALLATSQRLNLITTELQEGVMKTRMQPIGNVWNKLPRVVRDLASACQKQVRIEMEGKETELDKTILESIKDPLTHIVRNSVDHGIETPEQRIALGKPAEGVLRLRAFHEGGQVNIEISDDGRGIDPQRLREKAISKRLVTPDQAQRMSDRELIGLIFTPGFSTAEQVTNVSGRGVGMDVVKTNIEKIGGTIEVQSRVDEGTNLRIKIPLTLAIIPALVVTSGGERYAIPQVSLLELVRLDGEQAKNRIEDIHGSPVYRLRGNLLPLVHLNRLLGIEASTDEEATVVNIVVLQADDRQFGVVVDHVNDTEEIVVKPLGPELKGISAFAGATIMGDGRVALILDVLGIAQAANVVSEARDRAKRESISSDPSRREEHETLLLFTAGGSRMAIPLSIVARLEEFSVDAVEKVGDYAVIQYRDRIMPLIWMSRLVAGAEPPPPADAARLQVIVYAEGDRRVGLVVDEIVDVVDEELRVEPRSDRSGIEGAAVIQRRVTEVLDLHSLVHSAHPDLFESTLAGVGA